MMLNPNLLFASLLWGSVGIGYTVYGRKQRALVPFLGGLLMITVSYFANSVLVMSLTSGGLMTAVYLLEKQGY